MLRAIIERQREYEVWILWLDDQEMHVSLDIGDVRDLFSTEDAEKILALGLGDELPVVITAIKLQ